MSSAPAPSARLRAETREKILAEVSTHVARLGLGALAFDLLSRQAEGRALFAGRDLVLSRAAEHGVDREGAATVFGNLLAILERGPEGAVEHALVGAFAVLGLGERLKEADEHARAELIARFLRQVEWLETSTAYEVHPFIDPLLDPRDKEALWAWLEREVMVAQIEARDAAPAEAARVALRLALLSRATEGAAALSRIAAGAGDQRVRALGRAFSGEAAESSPAHGGGARIEGNLGPRPRGPALALVRVLSGFALAAWASRALLYVVGFARRGSVAIDGEVLDVRVVTTMLGRPVRERHAKHRLEDIVRVERVVRYPALITLVGVVALAVGVLIGAVFALDGLRAGEPKLLMVSAALVLLGAGVDLLFDVLAAGRAGRVRLLFLARDSRPLVIEGVPRQEADAFVDAIRASATARGRGPRSRPAPPA